MDYDYLNSYREAQERIEKIRQEHKDAIEIRLSNLEAEVEALKRAVSNINENLRVLLSLIK